jgi:hypothetical protein
LQVANKQINCISPLNSFSSRSNRTDTGGNSKPRKYYGNNTNMFKMKKNEINGEAAKRE